MESENKNNFLEKPRMFQINTYNDGTERVIFQINHPSNPQLITSPTGELLERTSREILADGRCDNIYVSRYFTDEDMKPYRDKVKYPKCPN